MAPIEVWLRGPLPDMSASLQPVAHSLLQSLEEFTAVLEGLTPEQIWTRPSQSAAIGFHARHAAGSLGRLFTYARGERLSPEQIAALDEESEPDVSPETSTWLLADSEAAVKRALEQLRATPEVSLFDVRTVGRAQLPSTVLGLLFHGAEHMQRHAGQAMTTRRIVSAAP